ncbi:MAG: hypothetical protein O2816_18435 [Planctomycetota bacterium]|nr:hypothetical protein [Planctomycetota bacterium]
MGPALLLALAAGLHPQDGPDADVRLTVEPGAVRLAVTLNLVFLDEYVEPFREHDQLLPAQESGLAQDLGFELLAETTTLLIDGIAVQPRVESFEVADPDPDLIPHFPRFGMRAMTKLRWVLEYPVKSAPGEVDLTWTLFPPDEIRAVSEDIPTLEIVAHVKGEGRSERITLTEDGNRIRWASDPDAAARRFLRVPDAPTPTGPGWPAPALLGAGVLALLAGLRKPALALVGVAALGAGLWWQLRPRTALDLDEDTAARIFEPLHQNLYRAFDYSRPEDVYDALAQSVSGKLLRDLYKEVRDSLVQTEQGGAVSEVQAVRRLSLEVTDVAATLLDRPAFRLESRWQVDGAVFHFGHSHWRTNEYGARVTVALTDEGWRLAEHDIFFAERVDSAPIPPDNPNVADGEREEDEF